MTAAVATRVPAQPGPPAAEQTAPPAGTSWDLVLAAKAGDRDAFGKLYELYADKVFRFIYNRCGGNRVLAEDLTGDTFVRALRNIGNVTWQGKDIGAWLVTIARNLVADHFKSHRFRREVTTADMLDADSADRSPEADPAQMVAEHLTNLDLLAAVQQLRAEQRECIRLRFLLGLSVAETAAEMGKQEGAIKALQYRATRSLAKLLPPGLGDLR